MWRRLLILSVGIVMFGPALAIGATTMAPAAAAPTSGPLHTNGNDSRIYDASNEPVRLVGFNWTGTENGGRADNQKIPDVCGDVWATPADGLGDLPFDYDNSYQVIKDLGYNVLRLPISWHNLEPVAPVWDAGTGAYVHTWNLAYLYDLKSMVTKAHAVGLMVILDMHQDYWSPALHNITNWDGGQGYCEGVGMPRWLYPTADGKTATTQNTDFANSMNWFYRNLHDPLATTTRATPWQLFSSAWDQLSFQFSPASGYPDSDAVVGADILNEPYWSYVGANPPTGQTVLQAAGTRLQTFYETIAPSITSRRPSWLLIFEDSTGGYNAANPSARETPTMTGKPTVSGNWVYSIHDYNFEYGTFSDGVVRHDDFGITLANVVLANANAWKVPLYIGEFTNFSLGVDSRQLTNTSMAQTKAFLAWAKQYQVSWTFWAYVNPYWPMTFLNYQTNQPLPVVKDALATGLDTSGQSAPGAPTAVTATAGVGNATVAFTPPANDGGSSITNYTVTSTPGGITASGTSSPITVTGLTNGVSYTFRVVATNNTGTSPPSVPSNSVIPSATSPELLSDPGFESGTSGWSAFNVGTLTRVTTPVRTGANSLRIVATSTAADLVGMTNNDVATNSVSGRQYNFRCYVRPTNAGVRVTARLRQYSQTFGSGTTLATTPSTTLAANTWTLMTVTGTANQNGYRLIPQIYSTNQTSVTGSVYYDDCSVTSGTTAPPVTVPGAPTAVIAVAGDGQATVSFTPPANNGGAPITGYTVTSTPGNITATGAGSPIRVSGLTNGSAYTFAVTAINNAGHSAPSSASGSVTPTSGPASELLPDPGFEIGAGGWVAFNVGTLAKVSNPVRSGTGAMRITAPSAATNLVGMTHNSVITNSVAGRILTFQCYVRPTETGLNNVIRLRQYTQAFISGVTLGTKTTGTLPANVWTLVTISGTATQSGYRVIPQIYSTNQTSATGTITYDDCTLKSD